MKFVYTLMVVLGILFLNSSLLQAQTTYDLQFGNPEYKEAVDSFCVTIQIKSNQGEEFAIGSHTFFFLYNSKSINYPTYSSHAFNNELKCVYDYAAAYYKPGFGASTNTNPGEANVTTLLQLVNLGCPKIADEWTDVGTVCFEIQNIQEPVNLSWDREKTLVNLVSDAFDSNHEQGDLVTLEILPNLEEAIKDTDGDGLDDDLEVSIGSDPESTDSDQDGIPDSSEYNLGGKEKDTDGDGILDIIDRDDDGDGISTADEGKTDTDQDGIPNFLDPDDDNDGVLTEEEGDSDKDGDEIPNYLDDDDDGDGIATADEGTEDTDGDEIPNYLDDDDDGDGISTADEGTEDTDGDEIPNYLDDDDDGDTILTADELQEDTDGDEIPNYLDDDDDGDGFLTADEGTGDIDEDGIPDYLDAEITGVEDALNSGVVIQMLPNPASEQVQLVVEQTNATAIDQVQVYDMEGKLVKVVRWKGAAQQQLAVQDLAKGIYMVGIYGAEQQLLGMKKLVVY